MNILFWTDGFWPLIGGLEVLSLNLIKKLQQSNYNFLVIADKRAQNLPDEEDYENFSIRRFNFDEIILHRNISGLKAINTYLDWVIDHFKPSIVHLNSTRVSSLLAFIFFKKKLSIPVLLTVHYFQDHISPIPSSVIHLINSVEKICCVSESCLKQVQIFIPNNIDKAFCLYNGLPLPKCLPIPLSFEPASILCLGRLTMQKGFDLAICAFKRLTTKFPEIHLTIVGDGEDRELLENLAIKLGIRSRVTFTGFVLWEDVPALINKYTMLIMPSRWEPFGLVAVEAAQMERPIIATDIDGLAEIVVNDETGILVPVDNVDAIANSIQRLLENKELAIKMGKQARQHVISHFSIEKMVTHYKSTFETLVVQQKI